MARGAGGVLARRCRLNLGCAGERLVGWWTGISEMEGESLSVDKARTRDDLMGFLPDKD